MKQYVGILILFISFSLQAQSLSQQFDVKGYAQTQTDMIKTALNLDNSKVEQVYKANLLKAYSVHKYIVLSEKNGTAQGKTLHQVISMVEKDAERGSGFQNSMKAILGDQYELYLQKFGNKY